MLGLDGATFDVVRPLADAGELPNLAAWMREGSTGPLASTQPPMSFPAWSSLVTGLAPGEHGLFDFTEKVAGAYRIRFTNASGRRGHSLFGRVSDAGGSVLALGVPATFPPEPVAGLLVSGFDAPVSVGTDPRSASDPALYAEVAARAGPWMRAGLAESRGFGEAGVAALEARVESKTAFALEALAMLARREGRRPDLVFVVFSESDTVAHHYWRDHDPDSPRHDPGASAIRRDAVARIHRAVDRACGALRAAYGTDAACVVLSDHGSGGASDRIVHVNRHLEECGLLARKKRAGRNGSLPRAARDALLRWLPPRVAQWGFRRHRSTAARWESLIRFGGHDWSRTVAFSEEANTQPGIWLNLAGREAEGCVAPRDRARLQREVVDALLDWKLPGGGPVVAGAWPRDEIHRGPLAERAPDVVFETALDAGYSLSLVPTPWDLAPASVERVPPDAHAGGRGRGMNGGHRPEGLWIGCPGADPNADLAAPAGLPEAGRTLLGLLGLPWLAPGDAQGPDGAAHPYSAEEEALVAERLRSLGYLD